MDCSPGGISEENTAYPSSLPCQTSSIDVLAAVFALAEMLAELTAASRLTLPKVTNRVLSHQWIFISDIDGHHDAVLRNAIEGSRRNG